jgi:hypothetical protein
VKWFKKHKILTVILVIIVIAVISSAAGGSKSNNSGSNSGGSNNSSSSAKTYKFDERADKQAKDVEVLPGEAATVGGVKMTLTGVEYKASLSDFEKADDGKTYVIADVTLENTSNKTQPYNVFDFRIQTAGGQVLDGGITSTKTLSSGDLVAGGKASGKIVFEVPVEDGHQYVIWKPNAYNSDRAIVRVK